ncbi:telomerase reverse transcriptase [Nothobranchius furzeri]|uniref:Telomerase reverse transcriptase n=1 Tax=Nothobranchius furzeri TaxID=105023 RepID=C7SF48_NOTFU|nr:telomerase reverse transcriptase [Nothobranchius furzeri]ACN38321.1 telomerase reverse transcriptase [Nothobranchius furzeri]
MSVTDMSAVVNTLRMLFQHVQTLEEFFTSVQSGHQERPVEQSDRFKSFTRETFVCFDKDPLKIQSSNQTCTFSELLAFIINKMKRKKKRNVLTLGYNFQEQASEDCHADQLKFHGSLKQSAAYIHSSDMWKEVFLRFGTDVSRYLLESCSLFAAAPPSCVFQLCGLPVYDRVSTVASSRFYLQPGIGKRRSSRFGRNRTCHQLKRKPEIEDADLSKIRKQTVNKRKRKREETVSCESKRRRVTHQEEGQTMSGTAFKWPSATPAAIPSSEGSPSWRSGTFPPLPPSQCFIHTLGFLYRGRGMSGFLLNKKKRSSDGPGRLQGKDLIRIIFFEGLMFINGLERKPKKLPRRFFHMVPLFNRLLQQHRKCLYSRILQRICPVAEQSSVDQGELNSLLPKHCAPHRVYLFVRECLLAVIPQQLWGSDQNRLHFFARVRDFLHSGKFEKTSLAKVMWKVKVNDCDWLKISKTGRVPPSELAYRTQILGQFLAWLLDGYVVGLVRACFYATEGMRQKCCIRFYRREVWAKLQDLAFKDYLAQSQMKELCPAEVASFPKDTVISRLRFIPKTDGMRPITRFIGRDTKTKLYQAKARNFLDALQACVQSNPSLLGSTVWGLKDIHKVLSSLAPAQKDKPQHLYFVKVDVSSAYESLPHDKLMEVIGQVLSPVQEELFTVRCYSKIWMDPHEGLKKSFVRQADFLDHDFRPTNMKGFLMSQQKSGKIHSAVTVEQHFCSDYRGVETLQFFTQMVTSSVVQYRKKFYRRCRGIPQGSIMSSLLCCLCYGHMERVLFKTMSATKGCLMRLVDDFLLITPDQRQAHTFLKTLLAGVPQYGLVVNPQKVVVNFPIPERPWSGFDVHVLPSHCLFPWCGLLLDTQSLDVCKDYSRYSGLSLRYCMTLGSFHSAGLQMRTKLMSILRLKSHTLFLDLKNNSIEVVYRNIYSLLLLQAYRFHACAQNLPFGQTVAKNPVYFLQMIWDMAGFANRLIRISNKGLCLGSKNQTGILQREAVELLLCLSFLVVLSQHRPLYRDLMARLHTWKRSLERRLGDLSLARVRQASSPKMPSDFLTIRS